MKSDFFIDRPVFSTVISIIIVLIGLIGLALLPIDQYPNIVPPVVKVSASYPGAGAETVSQAIAKKYLNLAQVQHINGQINYIDVLDAQRSYLNAEIDLSYAIRDKYIALIELYKSLGGGCQNQ